LSGLGDTTTTNNITSAGNDGPRVVIRDLVKSYRLGDESIEVLRGLSLSVSAGEIVSIM